MTSYPYVQSPDKIAPLFKKIGEIGIPSKFTNTTLKSIGFTSSNDARLVGLVKFLGFTDQSGVPTSLWGEYRKHPKGAMARAVRSAYDDLFQHYADANERDSEALRNYFAASSTLGSAAVGQMIGTFTAVCRLGDFKHVAERHAAPPGGSSEERKPEAARFVTGGEVLTVNINIQLQLPADATADTYERFFEAMRKHLLASGS